MSASKIVKATELFHYSEQPYMLVDFEVSDDLWDWLYRHFNDPSYGLRCMIAIGYAEAKITGKVPYVPKSTGTCRALQPLNRETYDALMVQVRTLGLV